MHQLQGNRSSLTGGDVLGQLVQAVVERDSPLVHLDRVVLNQEGVTLDIGDLQFDRVLPGRQAARVGPDVLAEDALAGVLDVLVILVDDVVDAVDPVRISHNQTGRLDVVAPEGTLDIEGELHGTL